MSGDDDIVQGVVLMLVENKAPRLSSASSERLKTSIIQACSLRGVRTKTHLCTERYLIDTTTRTVLHNMLLGIALIFARSGSFLAIFRSALIRGRDCAFCLVLCHMNLGVTGRVP